MRQVVAQCTCVHWAVCAFMDEAVDNSAAMLCDVLVFLWPVQILSLLVPEKDEVILASDVSAAAVHVGEKGELSELKAADISAAFRSSKKRVLFLDYGGTLVELEGKERLCF